MGKAIFLDIDGVLNSARYLADHPGAFDGRELSQMLDPAAVALLTELVRKSGAQIVISSSWRIPFKLADIRGALHAHGFVGKVIDKTPNLGKARGLEIQSWLDNCREKPEAFVILDDDSDMVHLQAHLVLTSWAHGLQQEHCERALAMLGGSA